MVPRVMEDRIQTIQINFQIIPARNRLMCCRCCNHLSNWMWVVEEILAFGTRLRSRRCREFNYLKLCRPAYFVRTTQLLHHPGHE